jgi:hypothetical protein
MKRQNVDTYTSTHVNRYTRKQGCTRVTQPLSPISHLAILATIFLLLTSCVTPPPPATLTPPFSAPFHIETRDPNATLLTPFGPVTAPSTSTFIPTLTPTFTLTPTLASDNPPPLIPVTPSPILARPLYTIYTTMDYYNHTVNVDESIIYPNHTGVTLNELVLAVEPMLYNSSFFLTALSVNGIARTDYSLNTHRLTVPLSPPLPPGGQVSIVIEYDLSIPVKQKANTFGWLDYQTNLTDWYPFVVPYDPSAGWLLHDFMPFGEHLVYDSSDFDVNIRFVDPSSPPIIAAPALPEASGEWTRYRLYRARTFALSMSPNFLVNETAVGSVVIRTYYFAGHEDAASKMTYVAAQEVGLFEPKFAPYPYPVLNVVELFYNDGQEYDGLVFLSSAFFDQFDGGVKNNMVTIGVHEIAHNWWFGLVGNDQALEPWLDEAMALYSERIYYEFTNPNLVDWWWQFRVNYFGPNGWVDTNIYDGGTFRHYTNAVYLNGATFIEDLRIRMGDDAFYKFIKDYAAQMSYRRATSNDFFAIVRQHTSADISDLISAYFANPH